VDLDPSRYHRWARRDLVEATPMEVGAEGPQNKEHAADGRRAGHVARRPQLMRGVGRTNAA
jgi:hypothetical protein